MKLYEIADKYKLAFEDLESQEDLSQEIITDSLAVIKDEFDGKGMVTGNFLKNLKAQSNAIKEEEKSLTERRKALDNKVKSLKDYLLTNMMAANITRITSPTIDIKVARSPVSVEVDESVEFPEECYKITKEISKTAIKEYIATNGFLEGARLVTDKHHLTIK